MRRRLFLMILALCLLPALSLAGEPGPAGAGKTPASARKQGRKQARAPEAEILVPERVNLGEPFVLRVRSRQPLAGLSVTWLERRANLSARKAPGGWEAVAVLGTEVGGTEVGGTEVGGAGPGRRHELVLRHGRKGSRGGVATQRAVVEVLPVERPVERLSLDEGFVTPPREAQARIQAERKLVRKLLLDILSRPAPDGQDTRLWSLPLARPVPGQVSSVYGVGRVLNGQARSPHRGLDLEAPTGERVLAAADGVVLFAGELYYAGNAVFLDHGQGLVTTYFHQSELRVRAGQRVARGQVVGLAGNTGRSTRSHLHFGVWALGRQVDPEPLFLYDPLP